MASTKLGVGVVYLSRVEGVVRDCKDGVNLLKGETLYEACCVSLSYIGTGKSRKLTLGSGRKKKVKKKPRTEMLPKTHPTLKWMLLIIYEMTKLVTNAQTTFHAVPSACVF